MDQIRILLADDHAVVRAGIRNALRDIPNLDFLEDVADGPSLQAALAQTPPDFLLIDVTMPDFEPLTTIRRIRADYPAMKILVVSAYDDDVYVQGLLGVGVNGYHMKDQPLSDLRLAVRRVLDGEKWVSSRLLDKLVNYADTPPASATTLTNRQRDILRQLQNGLDNQSIARKMGLSVKTIENHLTRLYRQLNVQSRLEAVNHITRHPELLGLPAQAVTKKPSPADLSVIAGQLSILLVDDNARYRHQLQRMVGKVSPQSIIYEAENIKEALHLTQSILPRLVFVDVVLGDENGIQCTRRIKAASPGSRIVLISAYPDREFHRLGLEAGAVAFLDKKDLTAMVVQQVINDVID